MTCSHEKVQGERPIGSKDRVQAHGWMARQMDGGNRITSLANAVGKNDSLLRIE